MKNRYRAGYLDGRRKEPDLDSYGMQITCQGWFWLKILEELRDRHLKGLSN